MITADIKLSLVNRIISELTEGELVSKDELYLKYNLYKVTSELLMCLIDAEDLFLRYEDYKDFIIMILERFYYMDNNKIRSKLKNKDVSIIEKVIESELRKKINIRKLVNNFDSILSNVYSLFSVDEIKNILDNLKDIHDEQIVIFLKQALITINKKVIIYESMIELTKFIEKEEI